MNLGYIYAVSAHTLWGLFPLYWRLLAAVPAAELASHRIVWSFLLLLVLIPAFGQRRQLLAAIADRRVVMIYAAAALLIAANWFAFLYAIESKRVLEASLGYYINPLLSVLLGVVVLRERLRASQWFAIAVAAAGVIVMAQAMQRPPWIGLTMAVTFALYGLVKKSAPLSPLVGLSLETGILFLPATCLLLMLASTGPASIALRTWPVWGLLVCGGIITIIPLALFAASAQRIPLTVIGFLQYIGPTLQFLLGVFVFNEPLQPLRLVGFALVWASLLIYVGSLVFANRSSAQLAPSAVGR